MKRLFHKGQWVFTSTAFLTLGIFTYFFGELQEGSGLLSFDQRLISPVIAARTPPWNRFFLEFTVLGSTTVLTLLSVTLLLILSAQKRWKPFCQLLLAAASSAILTQLLKLFVARERPPLTERLAEAGGFSFPSGHSASGAAIYFTLVLLALPHLRTNFWRAFFLGYAGVLVLLVSFSRVYLAVHYPSDALAGFCLGLGLASASMVAMNFRN